jgi:ubiquinone/menaquinone biosynthesis C-methylase UbiE
VLDIGTGTGRMIELFARDADRFVALDNSVEMLRLARAKLAGLPDAASVQAHTEIVLGDFNGLPFADASFRHDPVPPGAALCPASRTGDCRGRARARALTAG